VEDNDVVKAIIAASKDFNRFLVTSSLVPDLYCPGYSSSDALSKEANLMRTAVRYKADASKLTARVVADLSKKRKGGSAHCRDLQEDSGNGPPKSRHVRRIGKYRM
jgi:hypothetical protein